MKLTLTMKLKNGKSVTLSEEEARELYQKLYSMFGLHYTYWPYANTCTNNPETVTKITSGFATTSNVDAESTPTLDAGQ